MYDNEISHRQLTAWLVAAIVPPAIQLTAGASWLSVLLASGLSLLCVWLRWAFGIETKGKLFALLQWGLLTVVLGTACRASVKSWPGGEHPVIGVVLLLLALWSVMKGTSASARIGCVLFWFVLILYLVLLGAGVKDIKYEWLQPIKNDTNAFGCVLLLTPAAAAIHHNRNNRNENRLKFRTRLLMIGLLCTAAAAVTAGVLSPECAARKPNAFYEMTRSLNLFGQARRFEAVLSACMTAGWFSLLSLYLSLCADLAEIFRPGSRKCGSVITSALAAVILLCDLHIPGIFLLIMTAVFWVLFPLLAQGLGFEKKS